MLEWSVTQWWICVCIWSWQSSTFPWIRGSLLLPSSSTPWAGQAEPGGREDGLSAELDDFSPLLCSVYTSQSCIHATPVPTLPVSFFSGSSIIITGIDWFRTVPCKHLFFQEGRRYSWFSSLNMIIFNFQCWFCCVSIMSKGITSLP